MKESQESIIYREFIKYIENIASLNQLELKWPTLVASKDGTIKQQELKIEDNQYGLIEPKQFELKDMHVMKQEIITIINQNYWELSEKKSVKPLNTDFWKSNTQSPNIRYTLGKKKHEASGWLGQRRLIGFLKKLDQCVTNEQIFALLTKTATELGYQSRFAYALNAAIISVVTPQKVNSHKNIDEVAQILGKAVGAFMDIQAHKEHLIALESTENSLTNA
ncbi:MAG: hypothetical protein JSR33_12520 [Proteobacteria bacterium]|nr:hypothetical protein [Pseudomonadota bacterium]